MNDDELREVRELAETLGVRATSSEPDQEVVDRILRRAKASAPRSRSHSAGPLLAVSIAAVAVVIVAGVVLTAHQKERPAAAPSEPPRTLSVVPTPHQSPTATGSTNKVPPGLAHLLDRSDTIVVVGPDQVDPHGSTRVLEVIDGASEGSVRISTPRPDRVRLVFLREGHVLAAFARVGKSDQYELITGEGFVDRLSLTKLRRALHRG